MNSDAERRLHEAADKLEIIEMIYTYADCVDRGDFESLMDCFHPEAKFQGDGLDVAMPVQDFFQANADAGAGMKETMHHTTNLLVQVDGERARAQTYILAHHLMKDDCADYPPLFPHTGKEYAVLVGGRYIDDFERRDGAWKISLRKLSFEWSAQVDTSVVSGPLTSMRGRKPSELNM